MTNKENYDLVETQLKRFLQKLQNLEDRSGDMILVKKQDYEDYEIARNALQNLLIAADKTKE